MLKVRKRDGKLEDFQSSKISRVLIAAGLKPEKAEKLTLKITDRLKKSHRDIISSLEVKDIVISELKKIDPYVADLFAWYEKTKEQAP